MVYRNNMEESEINMAGTKEPELQENESYFQWDEQSQLYYHSGSGFYHDPKAGWYYSSRDGIYYKFEDGNYVLLETHPGGQSDFNECAFANGDKSLQDNSYVPETCDRDLDTDEFQGGKSEAYAGDLVQRTVDTECISNLQLENLPPPSEWLEDTLIELYLSGYSNQARDDASDASDARMPMEAGAVTASNFPVDGIESDNANELEEGEWIPDDTCNSFDASGYALAEGAYQDEETWRAQYGQVTQSIEAPVPAFPVVDLWDWAMVKGTTKSGKVQVCRLIGRIVRRSTKLHPSMPSNGGTIKTAPICEVHLDLVRVKSGQVYKLRSPKVEYLASLLTYDSSNPTKDWGFPNLSVNKKILTRTKRGRSLESKGKDGFPVNGDNSGEQLSEINKERGEAYRDRAAERRALHGGFGVGPGQKMLTFGEDTASSTRISADPEEAAAESMAMSFGVGSYARRILESMGWKEGEALGDSTKGLTEPIKAVGNKGSAGLGWNQKRNHP